MSNELMARAWKKVRGTAAPTDLPTSPLEALAALVPAEPVALGEGLSLGGLPELPEDPWREMIVSQEQPLAGVAWTLAAARLLALGRTADAGWLVIDRDEDGAGRHRAYLLDREARSPRLLFRSLPDLLKFVAGSGRGSRASSDPWAGNPASVEACLEQLWKLHPATLFQSYRMHSWPAGAVEEPGVDLEAPAWKRLALLWTLAHFRNTKEATLPPGVTAADVDPVHQALLTHLTDLGEAARVDEVPSLVADLALDDSPAIAQAALDWMLSFDRSREERPPKSQPDTAVAERTQGLMLLLRRGLDELTRRQLVEISPKVKDKLTEDLLEAVLKVNNPYQVVPILIEALLESPHVEEVYASDAELETVLATALGLMK